MGKLLALPRIRLYFLGNSLSEMGDYALWLAAGIWVRELTGSTAKAGLCFLCLTLGTLLSPLTGLLVDRVRRKPLIMVTNTATGLLVLVLTQVHGADQVWLVYGVMVLYGLAGSISSTATSALLPGLVPEELVGSANGFAQALTQGQRLITPALGVGLLELHGGGAVAVLDAASFAAGVLCWAFVRVEEEKPQPSGARWRHEAAAGFAFLVRRPALRQLTVAMTAGVFVMGFFETLDIAIVTTGLHHSPAWTGVLATAVGVTGILGGLWAGALARRLGPGRLAALGLAVTGASALVLAVPEDAVVVGGALLLGLGLPFAIVGAMTAIQLNTPGELLGRVVGADNFLVVGGQSLGIATGAALVSALYYRDLCYVAAGVLALATLYLATRPEQRQGSGATECSPQPVPSG
ncbi:MFS transporter [Kitasatospora sp. NBC_01250]|uniref:MFS transporter n=1 Tax=Kitasatospora sp. NBC_01250 TaxID=2903571 RepID=UPI002E35842E|nr:MFS transporter [Kitasatospora sp. NBC_01250]